jgi:hypothetical protein
MIVELNQAEAFFISHLSFVICLKVSLRYSLPMINET